MDYLVDLISIQIALNPSALVPLIPQKNLYPCNQSVGFEGEHDDAKAGALKP